MGWILIVVGALFTVVGLVMIPLPGPGLIVLVPAAVVLAAGTAIAWEQQARRRSPESSRPRQGPTAAIPPLGGRL